MDAWLLHTPAPVRDRPMQQTTIQQPQPGPGEALIRVRCCGVCRTDLHVVEGELDQQRQKNPIIPGHQIVGEILAINDRCALASSTSELNIGDRVGVAWLHCTCESCRFCAGGCENLCEHAQFTGWTRDGGYATHCVAPLRFLYPLPQSMRDEQIAPLLCAGIIGYRCLSHCELDDWRQAKLGIYGFGAAGHIAIQMARGRGADVYVCTRDERHQELARELGAVWVGGAIDQPPVPLDASIIFAPAGEIVPHALRALDRGGRLILGGIHMSDIPALQYRDLYWERRVQSVANNTRVDGRALLTEVAELGIETSVQLYDFDDAPQALIDLKHDALRGAAVLMIDKAKEGGSDGQ